MRHADRGSKRPDAAGARVELLEARVLLALNPTAQEQYMLELLNHLRADPAANLRLMTSSLGAQARSNDPDIDSALRFFRTSGTVLASQWQALRAVPPLAWNEQLYNAAEFHTQRMIAADQQTHQAPGEPDLAARATNAGYTGYSSLGENVYAFAESIFHGHAGFAIDWGNDADGLQVPPGHRDSMMNRAFREVGIRVISESSPSTQVGPLVITQDFGSRFNFGNSFLLGVVITDADGDRFYDVGEGLGGITIRATGAAGEFTTTSLASGGYQIQLPAGMYDITFSGGSFGSAVTHRNVEIGADNVKLDGIRGDRPPQPEIAIIGNSVEIANGDATPSTADWTDFGLVNLAQTQTRIFTIRNSGQAALELSGAVRVVVTGSNAFSLIGDAAAVIPAGGETSFAIRFTPMGTRTAIATIIIVSDDADEPTTSFRIRARGLDAPDAAIAGLSSLLIADGDTAPALADGTAFNTVNITGRSKVREFTLRNTGSQTLRLTDAGGTFVSLSGPSGGDFAVIGQPEGVLAPGQSTRFRIRFDPSALGPRRATVRIATNSPTVPVYDFAIRGSGVAAPIARVLWNGQAVPGGAALPSETLGTQFGPTAADGGAVVRTFSLSNVGSDTLILDPVKRLRVEIAGAAAGSYRVSLQPPDRIAAGQTVAFRIRFDPLSRGVKLSTVEIATVNAGTFSFNIAGTGV